MSAETPQETASSEAAQTPAGRASAASWWGLILLTLVYVINNADRAILAVLQEPIKKEFALSDSQLGLVNGLAFGLTYGLLVIPFGALADRVSRRKLLAVILTIWSLATAAVWTVRNFTGLLVTRMVVAGAESGTAPAITSMISDLFPPSRRATAISVYYVSPAVGLMLASFIGGLVAQDHGWRTAFLVASLPGFVLALMLLTMFREPKRGAYDESFTPAEAAPSVVAALRHILSSPALYLLILALMVLSMATSGLQAWIVSFLMRQHHLSIAEAGRYVALGWGMASVVGILGAGPLVDLLARGDSRRMIYFGAIALGASAAGVAAFVLGHSLWIALLGLATFGLMHGAPSAPCFAALLNGSPPRFRGVTMSVLMLASNLVGAAGGPMLIGIVSDQLGSNDSLRWAILITLPEYIISMLLMLLATRFIGSGAPAAKHAG